MYVCMYVASHTFGEACHADCIVLGPRCGLLLLLRPSRALLLLLLNGRGNILLHDLAGLWRGRPVDDVQGGLEHMHPREHLPARVAAQLKLHLRECACDIMPQPDVQVMHSLVIAMVCGARARVSAPHPPGMGLVDTNAQASVSGTWCMPIARRQDTGAHDTATSRAINEVRADRVVSQNARKQSQAFPATLLQLPGWTVQSELVWGERIQSAHSTWRYDTGPHDTATLRATNRAQDI